MSTGKLIVLEGLDGAGTTSQAATLVDTLRTRGYTAHGTRQPSDGPIGKLLRAMLTGKLQQEAPLPEGAAISQDTFGLLFAADRMDHLQREVAPHLAHGGIVVSDRWYHSSLAYQGTAADATWIQTLNARARRPDLTLFLRVGATVAAERRLRAGRTQELFEDLAMQQRVEAGYERVMRDLATHETIVIIDGEAPMAAVTAAIDHHVTLLLQSG